MRNWLSKLFSPAKEAEAEAAPAAAGEVSQVAAKGGAGTSFKEQGDRHLRDGALAQAVDCYRRALVAAPHDANVLCSLGFALKEQDLFAEAATALTQALAIDPALADAQYFLGSLYQASGDADLAATHFRHTLALAPAFEFAYRDLCFLLFQQGRLEEATQLALQGIAHVPESADLHFYLGNLYHAQQRPDAAVASFRRSLTIQPARPDVLANLGHVLQEQGKTDEAIACFQLALSIDPDHVQTHLNLGTALQTEERHGEAVIHYEKILTISPTHVEANYQLGVSLQYLGQFENALASYRRALKAKPDLAIAHVNSGAVLQNLEKFDEAMLCYRRALEIEPNFADAHVNLGIILQLSGKAEDAAASYRRALAIRPNFAKAHNKLGSTLLGLGNTDAAVNSYRQAVQIDPEYAEAHFNLGTVLNSLHQLHDAEISLRNAVRIKPDYVDAYNNLASVLTDLGHFDDAMASYRRALQIKPHFFEARSNLLFIRNYIPGQDPENLLEEAIEFGNVAAQQAHPYTDWPSTPVADRRLRIGMVSPDFRHHPVGFFVEGILKELASRNANSLEFIAYSVSSLEDYLTDRIKASFHAWHPVAEYSNEDLARKIHDDGIDILIDLSGHTSSNRLPMFAWKPAPVQVSWLGYFATTGVSAIDYFIGDHWTLPVAEEVHFVEKIWRLPETRLSLTIPDIDAEISPLPCVENGHITFGCFNNLSKLNDPLVALWGRVLQAIPESRLFLKAMQLADSTVRKNVLARFAAHGIQENRISMEGFSTRPDYLSAYHRVDIALDPFPYTGGTTSAESLWMGVPVLTMAGESLLSRQGVGLLMNAGLSDWIAVDTDDYVARAVRHAEDRQSLAALRKALREQVQNSPIFDAKRFARHFEIALRDMWAQWCSEQAQTKP